MEDQVWWVGRGDGEGGMECFSVEPVASYMIIVRLVCWSEMSPVMSPLRIILSSGAIEGISFILFDILGIMK